jgi:hypothetical protein
MMLRRLARSARPPRLGAALVATLAALAPLIARTSASAQPGTDPIVRAVSVQGIVEARRAGQASWQPVRLNDGFAVGDTIRVRERSRADLAMLDQSMLRLNDSTS